MVITGREFRITFVFFLFIIPLNIDRVGNNLCSGIQWALFHYQQTIYGSQVFTIVDDLGYVFLSIIGGRSAISLLLWSCATFILIAVIAILFLTLLRGIPNG